MRVGEVLLSKNGDTGIQFIELEDPFGESFPSSYTLQVFDAAGTQIGSSIALAVASGTTRMLIATAAAKTEFGTSANGPTLTVALSENGQACFARTGNVRIHCVAWGCINTFIVATAQSRAPSPPDGQSAQIQSNGFYQLATPTPDTANTVGTTASNCPSEPDAPPPVDGPVTGGDGGVPPDAVDNGAGDAGNNGGNNNGDDGGGCCQVDGSRSALGACLLGLGVVLALRRSRRR
ncbi:MAG TPA: hypothetical protein VFV99_00890 [Kofleriaceae bacterium]|nr:hypothetical protein [Kofleriaceae bacterium]